MKPMTGLFIVSLGLSGCTGQPDNYNFVMSSDTDEQDIAAAVLASNEWNECGIGVLTSVSVGDSVSKDQISIWMTQTMPPAGNPKALGDTTYWNNNNADLVSIRIGMGSVQTRQVMAHEFGHVMGLGHRPEGLMRAEYNSEHFHVTETECQALQRCRQDPSLNECLH